MTTTTPGPTTPGPTTEGSSAPSPPPASEAESQQPVKPRDLARATKAAPAKAGDREIKPLKANLSKACYDFAVDLPVMMRHWPKTTRMGLGRRLEENAYMLLEGAVTITNPILDDVVKRGRLQDMSSASDIVLVYLRLAWQLQNIDASRYANLAEKVVQIGKQVGGLERHLRMSTQKTARGHSTGRPLRSDEDHSPGPAL